MLRRVLSRAPFSHYNTSRLAHNFIVQADDTHEDPVKIFPGTADEPGVVVYGRPTVRVQKVYNILQELDIPYIKVNFSSPPPEWYLTTIHATGLSLVPSIRDSTGLTLSDSNSICTHLAYKYRDKGLWPDNPAHVGQALMWADFIENFWATPRFNPVFHACVNGIYPPSTGKPGKPSDEEISAATQKSVDCLLILEEHLRRQDEKKEPFLISEKFTFVDALTAPWLYRWVVNASAFDKTLSPSQFAFISRYYDRLSARPAFAAAMDI